MSDVNKTKITLKQILFLQTIIMIYTLSGVCAKLAAGFPFMSFGFIALYAGEIAILGVYAILWQQVIKRIDLSVAYTNRSIALIWSLVWAVLFFKDRITPTNIIGAVIVVIGTIIVNSEHD